MGWIIGTGVVVVLAAVGWVSWRLVRREHDLEVSEQWQADHARSDGSAGWEHGQTLDDDDLY